MKLPARIGAVTATLPPDCRRITLVGANGSGKSRFASAFRKQCRQVGVPVFGISSLDALYGGALPDTAGAAPAPECTDDVYAAMASSPAFLRNDARTPLERMISMLLNEEIASLISYKTCAGGNDGALPRTKIDTVLRLWRSIFPDSKGVLEGGALIFSRRGNDDRYSHMRLSHGEKAVLYYLGAVLFAPEKAVVFVDNPGLFLHASVISRVWDTIESLRGDCRFVYVTHDLEFAASRRDNAVIWVKAFDAEAMAWDYELLPPSPGSLPEGMYMAILGARRPVLFIEGDGVNSIDAKIYPLVFADYTVRSLGSCNKVIEAVRTFNDLRDFHHLKSCGIVDRDRRNVQEVAYLRRKNIFVADVAEVENLLLLEGVVKAVASFHGRSPEKVFAAVKKSILGQFRTDLRRQALLHTRHFVKMTMTYRIDGRFSSITDLERHLGELMRELSPRSVYENFCRSFTAYLNEGDYASVLRVYNQKSMLPGCNVSGLCGLPAGKSAYIDTIIEILHTETEQARQIRRAISAAFFPDEQSQPGK